MQISLFQKHSSRPGRFIRLSLLASALAALVLPGAVAAQPQTSPAVGVNLVSDGSFETPHLTATVQEYSRGQHIGPWAVIGGTVDLVASSAIRAALGSQSIDLSGKAAGAIAQSIPTVPGVSYTLAFAYAANPTCAPTVKHMVVNWDGFPVADLRPSAAGHTAANPGWTPYSTTVIPSSSSTVLQFVSLTNTACGPMLDAVSVT